MGEASIRPTQGLPPCRVASTAQATIRQGGSPMPGIGRRSLLKTASVAAGGLALGGAMTASTVAAAPRTARFAGGIVNVRWIGGVRDARRTARKKTDASVDVGISNNSAP